jgi:hypothetical protein
VYLLISATYGADNAFKTSPELCIAPAVMSRMKIFSDEMAKYGESYSFNSNDGGFPLALKEDPNKETFDIRKEDDPEELVDILYPQESLSYLLHGKTKDWLL